MRLLYVYSKGILEHICYLLAGGSFVNKDSYSFISSYLVRLKHQKRLISCLNCKPNQIYFM